MPSAQAVHRRTKRKFPLFLRDNKKTAEKMLMENQRIIESLGNLIAEELAKAGTDPELIAKLKKDRITADKELSPMEFLLKLFDVPCCPRGELVAFTGKAKSGKTFVMSMMMAAAAVVTVRKSNLFV